MPNTQTIKHLKIMTNSEKYELLITEVKRNKQIWLLKVTDGTYAMFEDTNEQSYLPVWPNSEFAQANATDNWEGYQPESMPISEFIDWLNELHTDQILIGAFPMPGAQAMAIEPLEFKKIF